MRAVGTRSALGRIAALPPAQAEVVLLRVVGDLSVDDVAAIVGRKPGAVRALQHRALQRLAREVADGP
jgi:RNA polymerase sigma-70 factor (ECF subfamily)